MQHPRLAFALLMLAAVAASGQSIDDLNIQIHGYATQAFLYTNRNNWNTTDSSDGSAAWTEAVVNLSAQPESRLRIGIQARYSLLGTLGNEITLDWAQADFKVNEYFGVRAGKVKAPFGLFNETQDIDPAQVWVLLPQSLYPLASRDSILSEYGGVVYGSAALGQRLGKLEYRAYAGERVLPADDGYFQPFRDLGITVPTGLSGKTSGGTLRWIAPLKGLVLGASETSGGGSAPITFGPYSGTLSINTYRQTDYFAQYERKKLMVAAEMGRFIVNANYAFPSLPTTPVVADERPWYVMATYKVTSKLTGGAYYSSIGERLGASFSNTGPSSYQKDWTVSTRYDFSPYLYAKAEQHWMDGTLIGFSTSNNTALQPNTRMTLLKLGVSF